MKIRNKYLLLVVIVLLIIGGGIITEATITQVKKMKTMDTMGQIVVTMCKTLGTNNVDGYKTTQEVQRVFPSIHVKDGEILDSWGRPIKVSIKKVNNVFIVEMVSAGVNKVVGTKDDIIMKRTILGENAEPFNHP